MLVLGTYPTRLNHHDLSTVTPWSRVTQCLDPSTIWPTGQERWRFLFLRQQRVVISTYHTYRYTSVTSIIFCLTRNTCILTIFLRSTFFIIMQEIILIQRLCPDDLFICLQYISHILYIYTYVKSFFTILEPNIHAPPPPPTPPNPTLYFNWYFIYTRVFLY